MLDLQPFDPEDGDSEPFVLPILPPAESPESALSLQSYDITQSVAAHLLTLSQASRAVPPDLVASGPSPNQDGQALTYISPIAVGSPHDYAEDGIFIPGSSYLELHSTLRSHIFDTTRSAAPTRRGTPELNENVNLEITLEGSGSEKLQQIATPTWSPGLTDLTQQEEYELWKNWTDEVATWVRIAASTKRQSFAHSNSSTSSTMSVISGASCRCSRRVTLTYATPFWLFPPGSWSANINGPLQGA